MFSSSSSRLEALYSACERGDSSSFIGIFKREDANKKYKGLSLLHIALHFTRLDAYYYDSEQRIS